jgi:hypothetical protein
MFILDSFLVLSKWTQEKLREFNDEATLRQERAWSLTWTVVVVNGGAMSVNWLAATAGE